MFTRSSKLLSICLIIAIISVLGIGTASAADGVGIPGDSPANAVMPTHDAVTIEAGTWQWYIFRSQVPVGVERDDTATVTNPQDATIDAILRTQSGDVDFEVWSAEDLNDWINSVDFQAMGAGTTNEFIPGDPLHWQGSFKENSNFYLIVMNRSGGPATYSLSIMGDVRFPTDLALTSGVQAVPLEEPQVEVAETIAALPEVQTEELGLTIEPAAPVEEMLVVTAGSGPADALMPAKGAVTVETGTWQWYIFRSQVPVGVERDDTATVTNPQDATIDAMLHTLSGDVDFEVWSAEDLNDWINSVDFQAMGAGTTNKFLPGDPLHWQGSFKENSNFYLIVMNRSGGPATYSLSITGDVKFPMENVLVAN